MPGIDFNIYYRPLQFNQIIGNTKIKNIIMNSINKDTFQKVSLFIGIPGIGKSTFAKVIAAALQCPNNKNGEPCMHCEVCLEIKDKLFNKNEGNVCNIFTFNMAKSTRKDDAENIIQQMKFRKSSKYKKRIFILEEPQNMSAEAQDTMLTTLEYLPSDTHVIFCTTEQYKMKRALVSRAEPLYKLRPPSTDELVTHLSNITSISGLNLDPSKNAFRLLCKIKNNVPRDCIGTMQTIIQTYGYISEPLLLQTLDIVPNSLLLNFYKACDKDIVFVYKFIDTLREYNIAYSTFIRELIIFTKDAFKLKSGVTIDYYAPNQISSMKSIFAKYSYKEYIRLYEEINRVRLEVIDTDEDIAEAELIALAIRIMGNRVVEHIDSTNEARKTSEAYSKRVENERKSKNKNEPITDILDIVGIANEIKNGNGN